MQRLHRAFIIFPNQIFEDVLPIKEADCDAVLLVEEPIYFFDPVYKPFKPHKMKLAFLRACMKSYFDLHLSKKFSRTTHVNYVEYADIMHRGYTHHLAGYDEIICYDPIDSELTKKLQQFARQHNITVKILENPDLLLDMKTLEAYYSKRTTTPKHASFYEFVKKELNVLTGVKNLDKENRNPPPATEPQAYTFTAKPAIKNYYKDAIAYTLKNFPDHHGECDDLYIYPITHGEALKAAKGFLNRSLAKFGTYEDAVMCKDPFMYHSVMSPLMNVGLLTPKQVLAITLEHVKHDKSIPLSSLEGFLRQVIGWRAFMQSLYLFKGPENLMTNIPQNTKTFKDRSAWYNGTTGITPLDEEIKKVGKYGYAHHIVRLMMFMNFFILCELHPYEIYTWFMEVVSMDAYSWVMVSNIYTMGYFHPKVMSKPYISTSNYIVKMTDYKRDGHWDKIWDALYHDFLRTKPASYTFFYKRTYKASTEQRKIAQEFKKHHFIDRAL